MSTPAPGTHWVHPRTGISYELMHDCASHGISGWVSLRRVDTGHVSPFPARFLGRWFQPAPTDTATDTTTSTATGTAAGTAAPTVGGADEIMALAEAVGVVAHDLDQHRPTGQQPASEFAIALDPHVALLLSDRNLCLALTLWSAEDGAQ